MDRCLELVADNHELNDCVICCTTLQHNEQNTKVTVRYRWHPWFERSVDAVQSIRRGLKVSIRVEYAVRSRRRWIDVPAWMFDSTICASLIASQSPVAKQLKDQKKLIDE